MLRSVSSHILSRLLGNKILLVVMGLVVIDNEVNSTGIENGIQTLGAGLGNRARDLRADGGLNEGRHCEAGKDL
jgi:hypothetical protein